MMQKIIEEIRGKLVPYTGGSSDAPFDIPKPTFQSAAPLAFHAGRFVRKIPAQNYEKLGKFVPISWL